MLSDEAKIQEIQYLATMATIQGQVAEAKARKAIVIAELQNAQKDLADYQGTLDVLKKKLAEAESAEKIKAQTEIERKKLQDAKKEIADLEILKQKELTEATLKGQQLAAQKAKEDNELLILQQKMAALDKATSMLNDAGKIPGASVKAADKRIFINMPANNIFSTKDKIHDKGKSTLDEVAMYLKKYAVETVTISCYADNIGNPETNRVLTEKRAVKVKEYLVGFHNIPAAHIIAKGLGSAEPISDNKTVSARLLNRRIEIGVVLEQ